MDFGYWVPEARQRPRAPSRDAFNSAAVAIVTASHNPPEYNGLKVYSGAVVGSSTRKIGGSTKRATRAVRSKRSLGLILKGKEGSSDAAGEELEKAYLDALDRSASVLCRRRPFQRS